MEFSVDPARFHDAFAADLPARQSAVLAATQRPLAEAGFTDPAGPPAWKDLPTWAVVAERVADVILEALAAAAGPGV